ncbi:MAG: hypothetical protein WBF17_26710, partial [Phycisphaerae bacterium]
MRQPRRSSVGGCRPAWRRGTWTAAHLCAAAALLAVVGSAGATDLDWINPHGGAASDANNWSPKQVPTASDMLYFGLTDHYPVTFDDLVTKSGRLTFHRGQVDLEFTDDHDTGIVYVARDGTDSVETSIIGGELTGVNVYIGRRGEGTLTVTGFTSVFNQRTGADFCVGYDDGDGTLLIEDGGTVSVGHHMSVGRGGARPVGEITVSGTAFNGRDWVPSTLSVGDAYVSASSTYLGYGTGVGILSVSNGARADVEDMHVSYDNSSSRGQVSVGGAENGLYAALNVSEAMHVGDSNGSGTVDVSADGRVVVGGTTCLGAAGSGRGTLNLDGGELRTHSLDVRATGVVNFGGGTLVIDGGALTDVHAALTVDNGSQLLLQTGATCSAYSSGLTLGAGSWGTLRVIGGSSLSTGDATVGQAAGLSEAFVEGEGLAGAGSSWGINGYLRIGEVGAGSLTVADGAEVSVSDVVEVGCRGVADGWLYVQGARSDGNPSKLSADSAIVVGGFVGGTGRLEITDGGLVECEGGVSLGYSGLSPGDGTLLVSGINASTAARSTLAIRTVGSVSLVLGSGTDSTGELIVEHGGLVEVTDEVVAGNYDMGADGTITVRGTGHDGSQWVPSALRPAGAEPPTMYLGFNPNTLGVLNVLNGGLVEVGEMHVGFTSASSVGEVTVIGQENGYEATLTVAGDLHVGDSNGTGTVSVGSFGNVVVGGMTRLGSSGGGGGTLGLNICGTVKTHSMDIGETGVLNFNGGTLIVDGGTFEDVHDNRTIAASSTLRLENGAVADVYLDPWAGALILGDAGGPGFLSILDGSTLSTDEIAIGRNSTGPHSEVTVAGHGGPDTPSRLLVTGGGVGDHAKGRLYVQDGGEVEVAPYGLAIGVSNWGEGEVHVTGARADGNSSSLRVAGAMSVGYTTGGTGLLSVTDGGLVDVGGEIRLGDGTDANGDVLISGMHSGTAARSTLRGHTSMLMGVLGGGTVTVEDGGLMEIDDWLIVGFWALHETEVTVSGVHANGTPAEVAVGDRTILGGLCEHAGLSIRGGGLFTTASLFVGGDGAGTATVDGMAPGGERSTLGVAGAMTVSAFGRGTL